MSYAHSQHTLPMLVGNWWALLLRGIAAVLFGLILAVLPGVGLLSLVWLLGIYALVFGIALMVLGFRMRGHRQESSRVIEDLLLRGLEDASVHLLRDKTS